jgi:hypothetical protein
MMTDMAEEIQSQLNVVCKPETTWKRQISDASTTCPESDGFDRQVSSDEDSSRQASDDDFSRQVSDQTVKKKTIGLSADFWDNVAAAERKSFVETVMDEPQGATSLVNESDGRKELTTSRIKPLRRRGSSPSAQMMADMAEHKDWKELDDGAGNFTNAWAGGLAEHRAFIGGSSHKLGDSCSKDVAVKHNGSMPGGYANGQRRYSPNSVKPVQAVDEASQQKDVSAKFVRRGRPSCPAMQMMQDMLDDA